LLLDLSPAEVGQPPAAEWLRELAIYYAQHVEVLRRLAHKLTWRPGRVRQARPIPQGWPYAITDLLPGINEVEAGARLPAPTPETWVAHPLDLDIGEVADGYHLIAQSISLSAEHLLFEFAFVPERAEEAEVWLNVSYGSDIPVSQDCTGIGDEVRYARSPLKARYAWFDFFRPDYERIVHVDWGGSGQPDSDYLRNRIARLTFDLRTGQAQIGT
jgi:hypothetical protein